MKKGTLPYLIFFWIILLSSSYAIFFLERHRSLTILCSYESGVTSARKKKKRRNQKGMRCRPNHNQLHKNKKKSARLHF